MRASFYDPATLQDDDTVGHPDGRKTMRDQERRLAGTEIAETLENFVFRAGVER